jgi:hypothetical protein
MIAPDDGRVPWWRILWSLMGALLFCAAGWVALLFNNLAVASVALPLFVPLATFGVTSFSLVFGASILVWWVILFGLLWRQWRKGRAHAAA